MISFIRRFKKAVIFLIIFLFFIWLFSRGHIYKKAELEYGVTFSQMQAESLNLNWQDVYTLMLDDLQVKKLRLSAYWNKIESEKNNFFWDDLDWQISQAEARNVKIILAVGGRLPRWPECHFPEWTKDFSKTDRESLITDYISRVVNRYKDSQNIIAWQIENEPFLSHFGDCPEVDKKFLDKEIALVKSLDNRPIIVTDSGELSYWYPAASRADIFGTTMYRDTYSKALNSYIHYPITPGFFRFKKNAVNIFAWPRKWIVIELQAEPWGPKPFQNLSQPDRDRTMNLEKFKDMIEFSSQTGFKEFYLWGVEYWAWERSVNNRPEMWDEARNLFKN
jgi:hypothetical protein